MRTSDASYLSRGLVAGEVGMGIGPGAGQESFAVLSNPGDLGRVERRGLGFAYETLDVGTAQSALALALPSGKTVWGLGLRLFDFGGLESLDEAGRSRGQIHPVDLALSGGAAKANPRWTRLRGWSGLSVELLARAEGGAMVGLSFGGLIPVKEGLEAAWSLIHVGPVAGAGSLPTQAGLGLRAKAHPRLRLAMDGGFPLRESAPWLGLGAEIKAARQGFFRVGYRFRPEAGGQGALSGFSAGAGFHLDRIAVDYAYRPFGGIAASHALSLSLRAGAGQGGAEVPPVSETKDPPAEAAASSPSFFMGEKPGAGPEEAEPKKETDHLALARTLFAAENFEGALAESKKHLEKRPGDAQAWQLSGHCHEELGQKAGALAAYRRSLELDPGNEELRVWLGELERISGEPGGGEGEGP